MSLLLLLIILVQISCLNFQYMSCDNPYPSECLNNPYAMHVSASRGCMSCLRRLIDSGMNVNVRDNYDEIPLHCASRQQRPNAVQHLLIHKSSVDTENKGGGTSLYLAVLYQDCRDQLTVVKMLLDYGAKPKLAFGGKKIIWGKVLQAFQLYKQRGLCRRTIIVFMGIRRKLKLKLNSVRDTHKIIGKLLWATRFEDCWQSPTTTTGNEITTETTTSNETTTETTTSNETTTSESTKTEPIN